ncbi:DUF397 domain-containing protein [Streptomyces acidiscabies]|uniref:DUF397 domain-containing protein n=1 Tax=Streptomyces acidiscabies TaxID=42234 RepID=A0AAP6BD01_9ACTN|nr:DUF397 domain-containing protein [Streptomyces acidiscabies]MBP5938512.1 DUF397 domain-containing protein [Streptomyces sp. LBUM 1476]MBZ3909619.1 DUF397 domain-containing protein [Streptomyces acidiscabies]MDX2962212.1 DUF397 domain-containing protein [Streptomyces acidiscabies]MDX3019664.1 DUF397 domain-containing protein [Streptomyces acidiscabies]MDX3792231.1 DUF397 domain-containing protein [Streptomyces acidiscabies]
MRSVDLTNLSWRKSSYSNSTGGNCLEVSADLLNMADWHKSSYSNSTGGDCLEFAPNLPSLVPVRDSKAPTLGALLFTAASWNTFVDSVK